MAAAILANFQLLLLVTCMKLIFFLVKQYNVKYDHKAQIVKKGYKMLMSFKRLQSVQVFNSCCVNLVSEYLVDIFLMLAKINILQMTCSLLTKHI